MSARFVDAARTNTHVRRLLNAGWTDRQIITRAYQSNGNGRRTWQYPTVVGAEVAARVAELDPSDPPGMSLPAGRTPGWFADAACRGSDPNLFYPESHSNIPDAVRAVCASCRVASDCGEFAVATRELHGIWGGLSEKQRRRARRDRRWQVSA